MAITMPWSTFAGEWGMMGESGMMGRGPGIFNMDFCVIFDDYYAKLLFLEGRLGAGLCLPPILRLF